MALRERLQALKRRQGMTTQALAERAGVPVGTVNKLLNGETRNPTAGTLRRLADALECEVSELISPDSGGDALNIPGVYRLGDLRAGRKPAEGGIEPVRLRAVPLIGAIAAGRPMLCEEDGEQVLVDDAMRCDLALRVSGDSMVGARIRDGDLVYIRRQDDVDDGRIAAVIVDGRATLKRVYHTKDGLTLQSENPSYPPLHFGPGQADSIRILGLAVGFSAALE